MRCRLFRVLQDELPKTVDKKPVSLHSEIRSYGEKHENRRPLRYRSDIVIVDDATLGEGSLFYNTPSKGYGFDEYYGVIELKLRRRNGGSDNELRKKMNADIVKLKDIYSNTSPSYSPVFYLIVFDKRNNIGVIFPRKTGHVKKIGFAVARSQPGFAFPASNDGVDDYKTLQYTRISSLWPPVLS